MISIQEKNNEKTEEQRIVLQTEDTIIRMKKPKGGTPSLYVASKGPIFIYSKKHIDARAPRIDLNYTPDPPCQPHDKKIKSRIKKDGLDTGG